MRSGGSAAYRPLTRGDRRMRRTSRTLTRGDERRRNVQRPPLRLGGRCLLRRITPDCGAGMTCRTHFLPVMPLQTVVAVTEVTPSPWSLIGTYRLVGGHVRLSSRSTSTESSPLGARPVSSGADSK